MNEFHSLDPSVGKPKIGLALGSGVVRGWAHIGVIRALVKHGFKPDIIAGTSVGALAGAAYATDKLDELEDWARDLTRMRLMKYMDLHVKTGGLLGGRRLYKLLREHWGDTMIEELPVKFVAVASDMVTGHEVWLRSGDLVQAMRASFALPGIFPPMKYSNRLLVDGALVNPVPVSVCQALGANMIIAVNLNGDVIGKARKPGKSYPTVAGFDPLTDMQGSGEAPGIAQRLFRRNPDSPSVFGVLASAMNIIQDRLARSRLAGEPPDVMIAPRIGHIGLMEFEKVDELIRLGEASVEAMLPQLRDAWQVLCVDGFSNEEDDDPTDLGGFAGTD
jgi:NTE family protein